MRKFVSIDIGGTHIKSGLVLLDGTVKAKQIVKTPVGVDSRALLDTLERLIKSYDDFCGVGLSVLGTLDKKCEMVIGACDNLPKLNRIPLKDSLMGFCGNKPVNIVNDVNAAALGEALWGAGKGLNQFYMLTLGTGIGGAYVHKNEVLSGANNQAGEIGYMSGEDGSFEENASTKAFLIKAKKLCNETNGEQLFKMALEGNLNLSKALDSWLLSLAIGIREIIYVLDPGTVIIGGGISEHGQLLTEKIRQKVDSILPKDFVSKTTIVPASLGNDACLLGAIADFLK